MRTAAKKLRKNKKGSLTDLPYYVVLSFLIALSAFIAVKMINGYMPLLAEQNNPNIDALTTELETKVIPTFDYYLIVMWFVGIIGSAIFSFFVRTHPIFFPVAILVLGFFVMTAHFVSMLYERMAASPEFASEVADLPNTDFLMRRPYLALLTLFGGIIILLASYFLNKVQGVS